MEQLSPISTRSPMIALCPILQFLPIFASGAICSACMADAGRTACGYNFWDVRAKQPYGSDVTSNAMPAGALPACLAWTKQAPALEDRIASTYFMLSRKLISEA